MKKFKLPKKATTALLTALLIIFNDKLGLHLDEGQMTGVVVVAIGYIYGQSKVDKALVEKSLKRK